MSERVKTMLFSVAAIVVGLIIFKFIEKKMCKDCQGATQVGLGVSASGTSFPRPVSPVTNTGVVPPVTTSDTAAARMYRG
jgi:hypothetical protein